MNEETKDCTRLPVVAWWLKNSGGEKDLVGLGSGEHVYQGVYDEKIFLCRITDAQARLAEKNARIAQLAAHARGKNKALANALKEIERLRLNIAEYNEHESCWRAEIANLRTQLEQLQAAPAEPWIPVSERLPVVAHVKHDSPITGHTEFMKHEAWMDDGLSEGWMTLCYADDAEAYAQAQLEKIQSAFPLFDETGLSETEHHCEWSVLQERKRLHAILNPAPATADSDVREVK